MSPPYMFRVDEIRTDEGAPGTQILSDTWICGGCTTGCEEAFEKGFGDPETQPNYPWLAFSSHRQHVASRKVNIDRHAIEDYGRGTIGASSLDFEGYQSRIGNIRKIGTSVTCFLVSAGAGTWILRDADSHSHRGSASSGSRGHRESIRFLRLFNNLESEPIRTVASSIMFTVAATMLYYNHKGDSHQDTYLLGGITAGVICGLAYERDLQNAMLYVMPWAILLSLLSSIVAHRVWHRDIRRIRLEGSADQWASEEMGTDG
ncbi:hypothetical protein CC86DRAFT_370243 [Ophiobolus disseminans]|uniref:Uncharacterized protein n=1 Tax=Ophiobolus disseminans TaxID=1469910 RepID=A0A6A6ZZR9_9PLEO|nr:hypothetical protein CC86DRAFT_370243 [Ophiobolus disseminans]